MDTRHAYLFVVKIAVVIIVGIEDVGDAIAVVILEVIGNPIVVHVVIDSVWKTIAIRIHPEYPCTVKV